MDGASSALSGYLLCVHLYAFYEHISVVLETRAGNASEVVEERNVTEINRNAAHYHRIFVPSIHRGSGRHGQGESVVVIYGVT